MFLRMVRQSLFEGRRRKLLAAVTVALAAALITTLLDLSVEVGDKMAHELKAYGANIRVVPKSETLPLVIGGVDVNPLRGRDTLSEADLPKIKDIFWRNNIVGLAPELKTAIEVRASAGEPPRGSVLIGTFFNKTMALPDEPSFRTGVAVTNPGWKDSGVWPDDQAADQVLAGPALAARLSLEVGATLELRRAGEATPWRRVTVTGLLAAGGAGDEALVAPLAVVQDLTGLAGRVQAVEVSALTVPENELSRRARRDTSLLDAEDYDRWYCTAFVSSIAHQIEEAVANASARPVWQVASGEGVVIGKIQLLMLVVSVVAVAAAAMGISALMNTTVLERAREIGLMKALGGAEREIHLLFLSEAAVVGILGGLVGFAAGTGLAQLVALTIFGTTVAFHWISLPVVVVVAALTALAGAVLPARAIAQLMPVQVLYGRR
ncbi:MAG: FtsX-like permease family protein [Azospirillum sp.]|nr:FtsX-like permease family protein [Azospirillum sp.]